MTVRAVADRPDRWDKPFSEDMTDADVERLLEISPFDKIDRKKFVGLTTLEGILKNDARIVNYQRGDIIIREDDWGSSAFFILKGAVRVELEPPGEGFPEEWLGRRQVQKKNLFQAVAQLLTNHKEPEFRDVSGGRLRTRGTGEGTRIYVEDVGVVLDEYRTARIESGQFFGEIAAMGRGPRVATVFAEEDTELLEIRWQGLRDVMRKDDELRRQIDAKFRERALASFLHAVPMFYDLSDEQIDEIVDQTELENYGNFDSAKPFKELAKEGSEGGLVGEPIVAEEGHYPNGVILIRSGLARLSQRYHHGHRTISYLTPGGVYGFEEIAEAARSNQQVPLRSSLRAIGYLTVVVVPTPVVERYVLGAAARALPALPLSSHDSDDEIEEAVSEIDHNLLDFLVDQRYVQGTASMVIDLNRCTRCDDCVRACASTHDNNPRFIRHGPVYDHYMVANACMHCADPVCLIECPTGAIHRDRQGGQVVVNDQTCIGCTQCANNCPYDAIRMVEIRDRFGNFIRDKDKGWPLIQATKCDLCIDQLGGPSCARACPHDALRRIDMRDEATIKEMLKR